MVSIRTDQTMPAIAVACVDLMLQGRDVEIPVAPTRRPGLVKAIAAELDARGCATDTWNFVDPAPADPADEPDAGRLKDPAQVVRDRLDRLMVRRHAVADKAVRRREPVEHVDADRDR